MIVRARRTWKALVAPCMAVLLWAGAPPESPVADAAMRGHVDVVRDLLQQGLDVNAAQGDGMTALHWPPEDSSGAWSGRSVPSRPRTEPGPVGISSNGDA